MEAILIITLSMLQMSLRRCTVTYRKCRLEVKGQPSNKHSQIYLTLIKKIQKLLKSKIKLIKSFSVQVIYELILLILGCWLYKSLFMHSGSATDI